MYWPPNVRLEIYHLGVSIFMTKYDFELKKKVVMAYFNGEGGKYVLAKKYGITSPCNVLKWINNFKKFGDQGLIHPENKKTYSFEKKLSVVELYLSGKFSYQELALQEGRSRELHYAYLLHN